MASDTQKAELVLVSNRLDTGGGRGMLTAVNREALSAIFGDELLTIQVEKQSTNSLPRLLRALSGQIDGLDPTVTASIVARIRDSGASTLFIGGSNLGALARAVRKVLPQVRIIVFFHNAEARFFWGAFRRGPSIRSLLVLIANWVAERQSVRHAHDLVTLSPRDGALLKRLYGRAGDHVAPMALQVVEQAHELPENLPVEPGYALFVGGGFYANRDGIRWYAEHVAPRIDVPTLVVGQGMEDLKTEIESHGNIHVVGGVPSLAPWYFGAGFAVAPIFDGSGMKTKVAEAMMHNRRIIGTPEAFSGYEAVADQAGWICSTADEFVAAIGGRQAIEAKSTNLRSVFQEAFSLEATVQRFRKILGR